MRFYKNKTVCSQNFLITGGLIVLFLLVAVFCVSLIPSKSLAERAQTINRGDSKERVRQILGKPAAVFLPPTGTNINFVVWLVSVNTETWAYGHWFCKYPNFPYVSLKLRLFKPDTNDISVVF
ncbi:MAG: hypothetical protein WDN00_01680 [Limisphaerales bacterium]